jgi:hypothetical protein
MQKAMIVQSDTDSLNFGPTLSALNAELRAGWTVVSACPIGVSTSVSVASASGTNWRRGTNAAVLVILSRANAMPAAKRRKRKAAS